MGGQPSSRGRPKRMVLSARRMACDIWEANWSSRSPNRAHPWNRERSIPYFYTAALTGRNQMDRLIEGQADIAAWLSKQTAPVRIAVAFWGSGAVEFLRMNEIPKQSRVLLDISAGATNPHELRKLMRALPHRVRAIDRLHAKVWIGENDMIIGSANASANGLGLEGSEVQHWRELGALITTQETVSQAKAWFDAQWSDSHRIYGTDITALEATWYARRASRPKKRTSGGLLLDAVAADPDAYKQRKIYVAITNAQMSAKQSAELDRLSALAEEEIYAYEDWDTIPTSSILISLTYYDEEFDCDNPAFYSTEPVVRTGALQFVHAMEDIDGLTFGSFAPWRRRMKRLRDNHRDLWKKGDTVIDIATFVKKTND